MKKTNKQIAAAIMLCILLISCNVSAKEAEAKEKKRTGNNSTGIYYWTRKWKYL